jgi:hypothetical protein
MESDFRNLKFAHGRLASGMATKYKPVGVELPAAFTQTRERGRVQNLSLCKIAVPR